MLVPAVSRPSALPESSEEIVRRIRPGGSAVVALSGGVDSAVVAHLAFTALAERAHAITLSGPAVSRVEIDRAQKVARQIGIDHEVLRSDPLEDLAYRSNPSNRCYFCRRSETSTLRTWGGEHGIAQFLDGVHLDDLSEDRPGIVAMNEAGFVHPLAAAGWKKPDVRAYARQIGLSNWDAPSDACLASRVAHGRAISAPLLARIEVGEAGVRALGFRRVRVRTDGADARVEVGHDEIGQFERPGQADAVLQTVRDAGFGSVTLDPIGYRPRPGA